MDKGDRHLVAVWAALTLLTLLSFEGAAKVLVSDTLAIWAALGIALFKMRIVARCFMELHSAPLGMRLVLDAWLLVLGASLFIIWT